MTKRKKLSMLAPTKKRRASLRSSSEHSIPMPKSCSPRLYPDAEIVFTTPGLKRDVRAEKRAQQKANIERQIAGIGDQLRDLKARSATGQAMVLIRQREALQQQLGELE